MMRNVFVLLKPDWLSFKNGYLRSGWKKALLFGIGILFYLGFAGFFGKGTFELASSALKLYQSQPVLLRVAELNLLSAVYLTVFVMLFMTGVRGIYATFFEAEDLSFLLAAPVSPRAVFGAKLLRNSWTNFVAVVPLQGALLVGFGLAAGARWPYYPVLLLNLGLAAVIFTSAASFLVSVIMRYILGQRLKQLIMVASMTFSLIVIFGIQYYNSIVSVQKGSVDPLALLQSAEQWGLHRIGYLPHMWMAKALLRSVDGFAYSVIESLLPLILLAVALFLGAITFARYCFLTGWSRATEYGGPAVITEPEGRKEGKAFTGPGGSFFGVLRKDLRLLMRTPSMWYGTLVTLVVIGFMLFNIHAQSKGSSVDGPGDSEIFKLLTLFPALLVSTAMNGRVGSIAVSIEGKAWWLIKSAPVSPAAFYLAKYLFSLAAGLIAPVVIVITMAVLPSIPAYPLYISLPVAILAGTVTAAVGLIMDMWAPDFSLSLESAMDKGQKASSGKQIVSILISAVLVICLAGIFAFPLYYKGLGLVSGFSPMQARVTAYLALLLAAVAINYGCFRVACKRLGAMFAGEVGGEQ